MLRVFLLAALVASPSVAPTSVVSPTPKQPWIVNYAANSCILMRERVGDLGGLMVESHPYAVRHQLLFLLPKNGSQAISAPGHLSVPDTRAGGDEEVSIQESSRGKDRVVRALISNDQLKLAEQEPTLGVSVPGKLDASVSIVGLAKARIAIGACERGLAAKWGAPKNWTVNPVALGDDFAFPDGFHDCFL